MGNRTILVDNNTWNNTHISRVGQAMSSTEEHAYGIMKQLDVDYVLVVFGGITIFCRKTKTKPLKKPKPLKKIPIITQHLRQVCPISEVGGRNSSQMKRNKQLFGRKMAKLGWNFSFYY